MDQQIVTGAADLEKVGNALAEYSKVDAGLAQLRDKYVGVIYDVATPAGLRAASEARRAVREPRYRVEEIRKSAKAPILALGKQIDGEAKRITAALLAIEEPIDEQIKKQEAYDAEQKRQRQEAERVRITEIQRRLVKLESLSSGEFYTSTTAPDRLMDLLQQLESPPVFDYQEFSARATELRQKAIVALRQAHVESIEREERQAAWEAAKAAQAALEAAERAERERLAAEARAAEEARLAEVRRRLDEEKAEQERQAAARRAADEQRAREERERVEAERKEQARIAAHQERLNSHRAPLYLTATDSPALLRQTIHTLEERIVDESYEEFQEEALRLKSAELDRLSTLLEAAELHRAEQQRLTAERIALAEQERAQAERQAEIERREREQREAEERRQAAQKAEEERRERAARVAMEEAEEMRQRLSSLTAADISEYLADEFGCDPHEIAARIADIPHDDWVALALTDQKECAA